MENEHNEEENERDLKERDQNNYEALDEARLKRTWEALNPQSEKK